MRVPSLSVLPAASKLALLLLPVSYSHKYRRNKPHVKMFLVTVRVTWCGKFVTEEAMFVNPWSVVVCGDTYDDLWMGVSWGRKVVSLCFENVSVCGKSRL
jgi:hypothetical protein